MKVTVALDKKAILLAMGYTQSKVRALRGNPLILYRDPSNVSLKSKGRRAEVITVISGPINPVSELLKKLSKVHNLDEIEVL